MKKRVLRTLDLQYYCFVVDDRPLCIWDMDLNKRSIDFLDSLDPEYYEFIADNALAVIAKEEDEKNKQAQRAALLLRFTYSQALETHFALLMSAIQATRCVPAWINEYKTSELYNLIRKIKNHTPILSHADKDILSWKNISEAFFVNIVCEDKEREIAIKEAFANLWSQLSFDFLDEGFREEYNFIKHGFRARSGGFNLAVGVTQKTGTASNAMTLLGKSNFGTSYLANRRIGDNKDHIILENNNRNWDPEHIANKLKLISLSISNVVSALKIFNGIPANEVRFHWPNDIDLINELLKNSKVFGVTSMSSFDVTIRPDFIDPFSKSQILTNFKEKRFLGVKHVEFEDSRLDYFDELDKKYK